jgi:low temperature requirement protein LtrA
MHTKQRRHLKYHFISFLLSHLEIERMSGALYYIFFAFILAAGSLIRKAMDNLALTFFLGYETQYVFRFFQLTWLIRQEEFITLP